MQCYFPNSYLHGYNSGSDRVTFENHGHFYFISGYRPGHRQAGQKIDILVVPATSDVSPDPSTY
jgi:hypothetical protein